MANGFSEIAETLKKADNVLILAHTQPDGDTLGSCFALRHALSSIGKNAVICCDSAVPDKYSPLIDGALIIHPNKLKGEFEVAIALDCADKSRLGKSYKLFKKHENTINIDHHITNDNFAKINYVEDASSVGELIFELLEHMQLSIDPQTAEYLYIAISTDTGNFTYSNTSKKCMRITSELVEKFDLRETADILFRRRTLKTTQMIGRAISRLEFHMDSKVASMYLTLKDMEEFDADGGDCDNLVNYAREIDTVVAAILFRELNTGVKVSLRSKGNIDVAGVAAQFGGGGHKNAAGCCVAGKLEEVKAKVIDSVSELIK